jgi:hypothetical protein
MFTMGLSYSLCEEGQDTVHVRQLPITQCSDYQEQVPATTY